MSEKDEKVDGTREIDKVDFQETYIKTRSSFQLSNDDGIQPFEKNTSDVNGVMPRLSPRFDRGSYESIFEDIDIYDYKPIKDEATHVKGVVHSKVRVKQEEDETTLPKVFVKQTPQSNPTATHFEEKSSSSDLANPTQSNGRIDLEKRCIESKLCSNFSVASKLSSAGSTVIPSSYRGLEIKCNSKRSNDEVFRHPQHEIKTSPKEDHYVQSSQMPPLCENSITTPTLSIQFSPFLTFSEDRVTNSLMSSNNLIGMSATNVEVTEKEKVDEEENENDHNDIKYETDNQSTHLDYQPFSSTSISSDDAFDSNISQGLTYADSLLLGASQGRIKVISTPKAKSQRTTPKVSEKKRKASSSSSRSCRQPQKRFSIDLQRNEIPGGDLFVNKRDGRVRLTTNLPRKVEAIDPLTGTRTHLYASCSEASRVMGINRTRMSRTCRGGGAQIGNLVYQYVEMSEAECEEESTEADDLNNNGQEHIATDHSALLLL